MWDNDDYEGAILDREYDHSDDDRDNEDPDYDPEERYDLEFADPGGESALRAASASNPRNLPCPTCKRPNMLTPADKRRGYQCDGCARRDEMGF